MMGDDWRVESGAAWHNMQANNKVIDACRWQRGQIGEENGGVTCEEVIGFQVFYQ